MDRSPGLHLLDIIVQPPHDMRSSIGQIYRHRKVGVYKKCAREGDKG
jgi:hypothetical protein